jgi:hypothetical protein
VRRGASSLGFIFILFFADFFWVMLRGSPPRELEARFRA